MGDGRTISRGLARVQGKCGGVFSESVVGLFPYTSIPLATVFPGV